MIATEACKTQNHPNLNPVDVRNAIFSFVLLDSGWAHSQSGWQIEVRACRPYNIPSPLIFHQICELEINLIARSSPRYPSFPSGKGLNSWNCRAFSHSSAHALKKILPYFSIFVALMIYT